MRINSVRNGFMNTQNSFRPRATILTSIEALHQRPLCVKFEIMLGFYYQLTVCTVKPRLAHMDYPWCIVTVL